MLAEDLGISTENTAKWWQNHVTTGEGFSAGQLVILDEASLAGTFCSTGASPGLRRVLVRKCCWLVITHSPPVDAGGAFGLLAHSRDDVPELVDVHRFTHVWEKIASLDLRHGRTEAIDVYERQGRIKDGETEAMIDAAYEAWRADRAAGGTRSSSQIPTNQ